jgi:E3 ubiquitin-protein ligase FANCL
MTLLHNGDFSVWEGFVFGDRFFIRLIVSNDVAKSFASAPLNRRNTSLALPMSLRGSTLECDRMLSLHLINHTRLIEQRLNTSYSIDSFLLELNDLLKLNPGSSPPCWNGSTSLLLNDLERVVGWNNIVQMDRLDEVHLRLFDAAQRSHVIQLQFRDDYPHSAPTVRGAAMPVAIELPASAHTLRDVVEHCGAHIARFQAVWRVLDEFDARCYVLEPAVPSAARDVLARRIALGAHRTLSLLVDWHRPHAMPRELTLNGPEAAVQPLRQRLASGGAQQWNNAASLADNLATILGIELPSADTYARDEIATECGICYAYRRESVPDTACNNERCGRPYHKQCLFEWLQSVPSNASTFGTIFGQCPYCSGPLFVKQQ